MTQPKLKEEKGMSKLKKKSLVDKKEKRVSPEPVEEPLGVGDDTPWDGTQLRTLDREIQDYEDLGGRE